MKVRRMLSLLLTFVMLIVTVAACSESTDGNVDTTDGGQSNDEVTAEDVIDAEAQRNAVSDDLPEEDFGGYNFRIYYYGDEFGDVIAPQEISGDVINDAMYSRNSTVEERFNINISSVYSSAGYNEHAAAEKRVIMAGDDAFDISFVHIIGGPNNSLEGLYINFHDIPYLNFDKPWWQDAAVSELTLNGKMYVASNDISTEGIGSSKVIYFNKTKISDYNMQEPYSYVFDEVWTLDLLISLTKDIYEDVNGNGEKDHDDFYGYISHSSQNGFLVSCDVSVLKKTNDDSILEIDVNSDKMLTLVEKMYNWYYETDGAHIIAGNDPATNVSQGDWQANLFADGRSMFAFSHLSKAASTFRFSDVEYGILPFPKWDENQSDYRTFSSGLLFAVPITANDLDRTGIIIEALSAEGYKQVIPAYFETALKEKFTFDAESAQVLDIINESRAISFAYAYDNWEGFGHIFSSIFGSAPSKDYSSFYAKRITLAEARLQKIVESFK